MIPNRVTQTELARRLGVSQGAVNRALSGHGGISEALARQIRDLADSLGYRPNFGARAMRDGRVNIIALIVSGLGHGGHTPSLLIGGIEHELVCGGNKLHVTDLPGGPMEHDLDLPKLMKELVADGLIINYVRNRKRAAELTDLADHYRLPIVWTNDKKEFDAVYPDDFAAGQAAAENLLALGHRRIAFFRLDAEQHFSTTDRYQGYARVLQSAGLSPRLMALDPSMSLSEHIQTTGRNLAADDRPTALIAYEMRETNVALFAAMQQGLKVPQDLSIIAFSDFAAEAVGLPIRTIQTPFSEVGRQAVRMLARKIADGGSAQPSMAIRFTRCYEGASCAPPATS